MRTALSTYDTALRQAEGGTATPLSFLDPSGTTLLAMDAGHWCAEPRPGDLGLLDQCSGPTLDVGCGPGRLAAALTRRGVRALGIDVSAEAVRQARSRGALALQRDVYSRVPAEGRWQHVLLADGNIGIGGDPLRLLRRCRQLVTRRSTLIVELGPPGSGTWRRTVRLRCGDSTSPAFAWAAVAADDLAPLAEAAAMILGRMWMQEERWFASLHPAS